jgi:hypothetical protein
MALAALVIHDAAMIGSGQPILCADDVAAVERLTYELRERGLLPWPESQPPHKVKVQP